MWLQVILLLSVVLDFKFCYCDFIKLEVFRVIDSTYSLVNQGVEERSGTNLTLFCELSSEDQTAYDDQIIWGKASDTFHFKNETDLEVLAKGKSPRLIELVQESQAQDVNRATRTFSPLQLEDQGVYFCGSIKFKKFRVVPIEVRKQKANDWFQHTFNRHSQYNSDNLYCNEKMFKCKSGNACINQHYVCDKSVDCTDGSDESYETCKGDPCADKLQCDDGRCIPRSWCCDRHVDPACNVTYKPSCCPDDNSSPFESEFAKNAKKTNSGGGGSVKLQRSRYVIITVFVVATSFGIMLMLLLMSKIMLYAKKTSRQHRSSGSSMMMDHHHHHFQCRAAVPMRMRRHAPPDMADQDGANGTMDLLILSDEILRRNNCGAGGGGVVTISANRQRGVEQEQEEEEEEEDRPPSYAEVVEAPPPYTSQDCLNHQNR